MIIIFSSARESKIKAILNHCAIFKNNRIIILWLFVMIMLSIEAFILVPSGWHDFVGSILGAGIALGGTLLGIRSSGKNTRHQIIIENKKFRQQRGLQLKKYSEYKKNNQLNNYQKIIFRYCNKLDVYSNKCYEFKLKCFKESWNIAHSNGNTKLIFYESNVLSTLLSINCEIGLIHILLPDVCDYYINLKRQIKLCAPISKSKKNDIERGFKHINLVLTESRTKIKNLLRMKNNVTESKKILVIRNIGFSVSDVADDLHTIVSEIINDYFINN